MFGPQRVNVYLHYVNVPLDVIQAPEELMF